MILNNNPEEETKSDSEREEHHESFEVVSLMPEASFAAVSVDSIDYHPAQDHVLSSENFNFAPIYNERYSSGHLRWFFKNIFTPNQLVIDETGQENVDFYVSQRAIILPPASDYVGSHDPVSLKQTLLNLKENSLFESELREKGIIIVPVAQMYLNRNHWVTLHCNLQDPENPIITLIDSRPQFLSFFYPSRFILQQLQEGLQEFGYQVNNENFRIRHQAIQYDDIHCGACTFYNIKTLSNLDALHLENYCNSLYRNNINPILTIINYNKLIIESIKQNLPLTTTELSGSFQFIEQSDLNESWTEIDNADLVEHDNGIFLQLREENWYELCLVYFTDQTKENWIQNALEKFNNCFLSQEVMMLSLLERNSIYFNGSSEINRDGLSLQTILNDLESKYPYTLQNFPQGLEVARQGFTIKDPGRVGNMVRHIGVSDEELKQFTVTDVLQFDAALFIADAIAGHVDAMSEYVEAHSNMELEEHIQLQQEIATFRIDLFRRLKDAFDIQKDRILTERLRINNVSNRFSAIRTLFQYQYPATARPELIASDTLEDAPELAVTSEGLEDAPERDIDDNASVLIDFPEEDESDNNETLDEEFSDIEGELLSLDSEEGDERELVLLPEALALPTDELRENNNPDSQIQAHREEPPAEFAFDTSNNPDEVNEVNEVNEANEVNDRENLNSTSSDDNVTVNSNASNIITDNANADNAPNIITELVLNDFINQLRRHFIDTNSTGILDIFKKIASDDYQTQSLENKIEILTQTMQKISEQRLNGFCGFRSILSDFTFFGLTRGRSQKAHALYAYCSQWPTASDDYILNKGQLDHLIAELDGIQENLSPPRPAF